MFSTQPYGLEGHLQHRGDGSNMLRTETCCQPRALQPGDWLMTGDRVLAYPKEGGNGSVMVWMTGGHEGHHVDIGARWPLAMAPVDSEPLPNDRCNERGHSLFGSSGMCARCGAGEPVTH